MLKDDLTCGGTTVVPVPDRATAGQVTIWHCASGNRPFEHISYCQTRSNPFLKGKLQSKSVLFNLPNSPKQRYNLP